MHRKFELETDNYRARLNAYTLFTHFDPNLLFRSSSSVLRDSVQRAESRMMSVALVLTTGEPSITIAAVCL